MTPSNRVVASSGLLAGGALGAAPVLVLVLVAACGAFGSANTGGEPIAASADAAFDGEGTDGAAARPVADDAGRSEDAASDADKGNDASTDAPISPPRRCGAACPAGEYCCAPVNSGSSPTCGTICLGKYLCTDGGTGCPGIMTCRPDGSCE